MNLKKYLLLLLYVGFSVSCETKYDIVEHPEMLGFSPNGDGINDVFLIPGIDSTKQNNIKIINTHRKPVYSSDRYHENPWNGKINNTGKFVPGGVYRYDLEVSNDHLISGLVIVRY